MCMTGNWSTTKCHVEWQLPAVRKKKVPCGMQLERTTLHVYLCWKVYMYLQGIRSGVQPNPVSFFHPVFCLALYRSPLVQVLLHRSTMPDGEFFPVTTPEFNQDLFLLTWGPAVAALSYVFDNAEEKRVVQKAIGGFRCVLELQLLKWRFGCMYIMCPCPVQCMCPCLVQCTCTSSRCA